MTKRRNDSLCEADGLPAIFPHQHLEEEKEEEEKEEKEEKDTSSRTFPIRWLHNYHPHPSEHMFDHVCSTKVLHPLNQTFAQTQSKFRNIGLQEKNCVVYIFYLNPIFQKHILDCIRNPIKTAPSTIVCFIF